MADPAQQARPEQPQTRPAEAQAPVPTRLRSVRNLMRDSSYTLLGFLHGQAVIALILTVLHLAGFYIAKLPLWWASGLLVGLLTLVPYLGFFVGAVVGSLITVLAGGDHWAVVRLLSVMALAQVFEAFYLTPKILGRHLKMHPALVFLVVLLGAIFFGPLGAFLAAPLAAVGLLIWRFGKAGGRSAG